MRSGAAYSRCRSYGACGFVAVGVLQICRAAGAGKRWESGGERAALQTLREVRGRPGRREAFGVRVALAPLSDGARNSTQTVPPKSDLSRRNQMKTDEGGSRQDARGQGKLESFFASPRTGGEAMRRFTD